MRQMLSFMLQALVDAAGGRPHLLELAGRYANGFIAEVWTIEAREQRAMVREAARRAGRDPDEIKVLPGLMTTVAPTVREGLDRRLALAGEAPADRCGGSVRCWGWTSDPSASGTA
jgi:alkanesulfonate monooxygenase SsuD/methylene tetrahydromethanopterin reductase-like flavin-dependent oxidoreductase (luciferase family)